MVRKHADVRTVLSELLPPLELAGRQHARHQSGENVEPGRVPGGQAEDEGLRLVPVRHALGLGVCVEVVGAAVGLAETREVAAKKLHIRE